MAFRKDMTNMARDFAWKISINLPRNYASRSEQQFTGVYVQYNFSAIKHKQSSSLNLYGLRKHPNIQTSKNHKHHMQSGNEPQSILCFYIANPSGLQNVHMPHPKIRIPSHREKKGASICRLQRCPLNQITSRYVFLPSSDII